jgi:hypothetical protein
MKAFFKVLVVALLATTAGLTGDIHTASSKDVEMANFLSAQAQVKVDEALVPVALPTDSEIFQKGGQSSSGRVTGIDGQGQKLLIERGRSAGSIPLSKIEKVVFRNGALVYRSDGRQIIRGERERPVGRQATWSGIGMSAFRMQNASQGQAVVSLRPPIVSAAQLRGIRQVASDRQYVVDEMRFNPQQRTMTILVTPY